MARFQTTGLDDLIEDLKAIGETSGELADQMLLAGAEEVRKAWRKSAKMHDHIDTGALIDSITYARKPKQVEDIKSIDIYPQGKDSNGIRNAEKAFVLNYGTSKLPASHWVDTADELCEGPVEQAMREVYEQFLKERNV